MVALRGGLRPSSVSVLALRVCVVGPLVLVAGCATEKPSYVAGPTAQQLAQQMVMAQAKKVEIEDDGQPVQAPPARRMRPEEDDPSQPWSPNYGNPQGQKNQADTVPFNRGRLISEPASMKPPSLPKQIDAGAPVQPVMPQPAMVRPQQTVTGTLTRLSDADADAVMTQAINAQEMRQR